ncbi:MAG: hypothetical protein K2J78_12000 [Muribaculaceae bacterium]|nr:hypothetical protein [Muribaculaceae bacterium]
MKKLFYLLLLMPLAFLASCNNDDDFPQVDLKVTLSNVYQDPTTDKFYYVEDEEAAPVIIDGLSAVGVDNNNAAVANVFYSLNNRVPLVWATEEEPTKPYIAPADLFEGVNYINISATVLQVDKSMAQCYLDVPLYVVSSTDKLPAEGLILGTYSITMKMQKDKK